MKKPVVELPPDDYEPTEEELVEDLSIDATPEEVARALGRRVLVKRKPLKKLDK